MFTPVLTNGNKNFKAGALPATALLILSPAAIAQVCSLICVPSKALPSNGVWYKADLDS